MEDDLNSFYLKNRNCMTFFMNNIKVKNKSYFLYILLFVKLSQLFFKFFLLKINYSEKLINQNYINFLSQNNIYKLFFLNFDLLIYCFINLFINYIVLLS